MSPSDENLATPNGDQEDRLRKALAQEAHMDRLRIRARSAAKRLAEANEERRLAVTECVDIAKDAVRAGITEVELKQLIGVNRTTIRRWIGKG